MWDWARRYPIKAGLAAAVTVFLLSLFLDWVTPAVAGADANINFVMRIVVLVVVSGVVVTFSREAWASLVNGRVTSPMGLVLGIWCTATGIVLHTLFEELPEAVLAKIDSNLDTREHDHALHWIHHSGQELILTHLNMTANFFVVIGAFLVLLAGQRLSKRVTICILIWIVVAIVFALLSYHYGIVPYFTNL